jgi:hypothetical protein
MTVTIIFKSTNKHEGQKFDVVGWEIHNSYNFIELKNADGSTLQFNLADVFSFSATGPATT